MAVLMSWQFEDVSHAFYLDVTKQYLMAKKVHTGLPAWNCLSDVLCIVPFLL